MQRNLLIRPQGVHVQRRRFVQGLAAGGVMLGLAPWAAHAQAAPTATGTAPELRGREFDLTVAETPVNFTGKPRVATTINGSIPGPTLRWKEGDAVTIRVTNRMNRSTSIHWHGMLVPFQMDGVPGMSFKGIAPGETFVYFRMTPAPDFAGLRHSPIQQVYQGLRRVQHMPVFSET